MIPVITAPRQARQPAIVEESVSGFLPVAHCITLTCEPTMESSAPIQAPENLLATMLA